MAKKLLNEAVVRRFQSLANISPINEMSYNEEEEEKMEETVEAVEETIEEGVYEADEEPEAAPELDAPEAPELDAPEEEPAALEDVELTDEEAQALIALGDKLAAAMEPEMDAPGGDLDLTEEEARVLIELGKKLEGIMGADAEMDDMEADAELAGAEDAMDMPEPEPEMPEDMLEGVSVEPSRKEVVEEVARRVARRLNEAKRAQRRLNRALGNK